MDPTGLLGDGGIGEKLLNIAPILVLIVGLIYAVVWQTQRVIYRAMNNALAISRGEAAEFGRGEGAKKGPVA